MSSDFIQWSLYLANMLLNVSGQVLIAIGCIFLVIYKSDYFFAEHLLNTTSVIFILIGGLLLALSVIGLFWVYKKNFVLEGSYIMCLTVIAIVLLLQATITFSFSLNGFFAGRIFTELRKSVDLFDEFNPSLSHTISLNRIQFNFKCCGLNSFQDWNSSQTLNGQLYRENFLNNEFLLTKDQIWFNVPDSCCANYQPNCGKDFSFYHTLHTSGCFEVLKLFMHNFALTTFVVCLGVIFIILLCIVYFLYVGFCFKGDYSLLDK